MPDSSLRLQRFETATEFMQHAETFLLKNEAMNNLTLGLTNNILRGTTYDGLPYFAGVYAGDEMIATAMRTPPFRPVLTKALQLEAVPLLAEDLYTQYGSLPGVTGSKAEVTRFVEVWARLTDDRIKPGLNERIYQNEKVIPVAGVAGSFRLSSMEDFDLLVKWGVDFAEEAIGSVNEAEIARSVRNRLTLNTGNYGLWLNADGVVVSMAGFTGYTPHGVRVGPVYTPIEHRKHGYGSAVTAAVTQMLLDSGRKFVFLFTDLANPTSNHIYMTIGYQPVGDVDEYNFEPTPTINVV